MISLVLATTVAAALQSSTGLDAARAAGDTARVLRIATAPAETLTVTLRGAGPAVVFVPGLLGSVYGFRNLTESVVRAGYGTVVVEPLGTGSSTRPDEADYSLTAQANRIAEVLVTLGVRDAVFVCHAMGGSICYRLAYRWPELVAGVVSVNGAPTERAVTPGLRRALGLASIVKIIAGNGYVHGKVRDGLRDSSGDPSWVTEEVLRGYTRVFGDNVDPVLDGLKEIAAAQEPEPLTPNLARIDCPVLLLVGGDERSRISDADVSKLLQHVETIEIDMIDGAGLYAHEEQPDNVAAAILRFLDANAPHSRQARSRNDLSPAPHR
jgi:4,5:9,10-diseco-3-hydroxy-5,9,17-trioxoandrosta-1(10),2-diene-4-oate hydrolase